MVDVLFEYEITDLSLGFHSEYHATAELVELQQLISAPTDASTHAVHKDDY